MTVIWYWLWIQKCTRLHRIWSYLSVSHPPLLCLQAYCFATHTNFFVYFLANSHPQYLLLFCLTWLLQCGILPAQVEMPIACLILHWPGTNFPPNLCTAKTTRNLFLCKRLLGFCFVLLTIDFPPTSEWLITLWLSESVRFWLFLSKGKEMEKMAASENRRCLWQYCVKCVMPKVWTIQRRCGAVSYTHLTLPTRRTV